tara:strand:- start:104 stop:1240 length:1137 start_codon:yes stop_codon:yes gene_type:complete
MNSPFNFKKLILFRGLPIIIIVFIAMYSFNNGIVLSNNLEIGEAGIATQLYYAISLFFLNGLDMGMPIGDQSILRNLLLICYFVAPLMTAIAIIETIVSSINSRVLIKKPKNHIIFVGSGTLTLNEIKKIKNENIIIIDKNINHKNKLKLKSQVAQYIIGDIKDEKIQQQANIKDAKRIYLFTDNDEVNIDIALSLKNKNIIVRAEDLEMIDLFKSKLNIQSLHEENAIDLINQSDLVNKSKIIIYGFGRFGQNILKHLSLNNKSLLEEVIIIDSKITKQWWSFKFRLKIKINFKFTLLEKDQSDISILNDLNEKINVDDKTAVIFCISYDNYNNIKTANILRTRYPDPSIFIRSTGSNIENEICKNNDIIIFPKVLI